MSRKILDAEMFSVINLASSDNSQSNYNLGVRDLYRGLLTSSSASCLDDIKILDVGEAPPDDLMRQTTFEALEASGMTADEYRRHRHLFDAARHAVLEEQAALRRIRSRETTPEKKRFFDLD